jgi:uncharacterized protein YdeI (YjbR/CyaY-like superfamily)
METILSFRSPRDFRAWLEGHHDQEEGAWVEFYKDGRPALTFNDALEEAFCFGWVDSLLKSVDETRYRLKFSKRRKKSKWSARNREIAEQLIAAGRMTPWGQAAVDEARANGAWEAVDPRPLYEDTEGFLRVLRNNRDASRQYATFTDSLKRHYAGYYFSARQDATREKRLKMIHEAMNMKKRLAGY